MNEEFRYIRYASLMSIFARNGEKKNIQGRCQVLTRGKGAATGYSSPIALLDYADQRAQLVAMISMSEDGV